MISLIVAMTENDVIGREGDMPWRMSDDLRRFKKITMGHHILMGRKTYESIGRPLPGRTSVVISRTATYDEDNVLVARSLEEAFSLAEGDSEIFVTGGAQIFALALPQVQKIYLTRIHCTLEGDTIFPDVDWKQWSIVSSERHSADERNDFDYSFEIYERTPNARRTD